jgi:hypothetical protein
MNIKIISQNYNYKILNKALRTKNIDLLFLLRFLIQDLAQYLRENQIYRQQEYTEV